MLVSKKEILTLIPQRKPIVMIDTLESCNDKGATTTFEILEDNIFCVNGEFTESGLVENIAQTAAAHAGYLCKINNIPVPIGFIGAIKNLEIKKLPKQNNRLRTSIVIENEVLGVMLIQGSVMVGEEQMACLEMKIVIKK